MTQNLQENKFRNQHLYYQQIERNFENLQKIAFQNPFVQSMIKFGTISNNKVNFFSDIDLVFVIDEENKLSLKRLIIEHYKDNLVETIEYDDKLILFIENKIEFISRPLKIEIFLVSSISKVIKYIINNKANREEIIDCIVFDKTNQLAKYFQNINLSDLKREIDLEVNPGYHVNRFLEAFENGSTAMAKGDSYNFYFQMNICYHHLISLEYILLGETNYLYLPRFFLNKIERKNKDFYRKYTPNLNMYKANNLRLLYLHRFQNVTSNNELAKKIGFDMDSKIIFLQNVLERTYFWNFRDISYIAPEIIRDKVLFRSSNLSKYTLDTQLRKLLTTYNIKSIIDLRKESEIEKFPYSEELKSELNYINIPIGEIMENIEIKLSFTTLDHHNAFYEIFPRYFQPEIRMILAEVSQDLPGIVIHCHAGKDRTGMIIALLLLICDISEELIIEDYLYSGAGSERSDIELFLKVIREEGGTLCYLKKIGIENTIIENIQRKILL